MAEEFEDSDVLARWLSGELSDDQLKALQGDVDLPQLERIVKEVDTWTLPSLAEDSYDRLKERRMKSKDVPVIPLYKRTAFLAAASIVFFIAAFSMYKYLIGFTEQFVTAKGETKEVTLPDGSIVRLNALSSVSFNSTQWDDVRKVKLGGNAYFEVAKGKTFTVQFDDGDVQVLGTRFEIITEPAYFNVFCYEGRVRTTAFEFGSEAILTANMGLLKQTGLKAKTYTDESKQYLEWSESNVDRKYDGALLVNVLRDLSTEYDVEFAAELDLNRKFTGTFVDTNMDLALAMVFKPLGITYEVTDSKKVILHD